MKRSKVKKIQVIEKQDALGISRKRWSHSMSPTLFVILKIITLILIPVIYFIYSPLLIVLMLFYLSFFFMAILAERRMNKSVIKDNQIKLPKFDTALALIAIVVSVVGVCLDSTSNVKQSSLGNLSNAQMMKFSGDDSGTELDFDSSDFDISSFDIKSAQKSNSWQSFLSTLKNLGSMLTGERNVFSSSDDSSFKYGNFDFSDKKGRGGEMVYSSDTGSESSFELPDKDSGFNREMGMKDILNDLPVDDMLSTILSSINTGLIFATVIAGAFSLLIIVIKKRKFDRVVNEVIVEAPVLLSDEEIERILSFGEEFDEKEIDLEELNEKIERDKQENDTVEEFTEKVDTENIDLSEVDAIGEETNFDESEDQTSDNSETNDESEK